MVADRFMTSAGGHPCGLPRPWLFRSNTQYHRKSNHGSGDQAPWNIIRKFIGGVRLRNIFACSSYSIVSLTKRPRSGKSGAAGDNHCFMDDKAGGCHRRNCPWEHANSPNRRINSGNNCAGDGDHRNASGSDSNSGGRGGGGRESEGVGSNSRTGYSGRGSTRTQGQRLCRVAWPTSITQQLASLVETGGKEGTRSAPSVQKGAATKSWTSLPRSSPQAHRKISSGSSQRKYASDFQS